MVDTTNEIRSIDVEQKRALQETGSDVNMAASAGATVKPVVSNPLQKAKQKAEERDQQIAAIASFLRATNPNEGVRELRALKVQRKFGNPVVLSGFFDFDHTHAMAREAFKLTTSGHDGTPAPAVYWTINRIKPELQARCSNRVKVAEKGDATQDVDITRLEHFLVDIDPTRPSGISATDEEKAAAQAVYVAITTYLAEQGWPSPFVIDSGNGFHIYYRTDLPTEDKVLFKSLLNGLTRFDTPLAKVDTVVFTPSHLGKLVGTWARKGDQISGRPHRLAKVLSLPTPIETVTREQIVATIADLEREQATAVGTVVETTQLRSAYRPQFKPADVFDRARAYLYKIPGAVQGQGGSSHTLKVAGHLVVGFNLSISDAFPLLAEWNQKCEPPWTEAELRHKLDDATKSMGHVGYLLDDGPQNQPLANGQTECSEFENFGSFGTSGSPKSPVEVLDAHLTRIRNVIAKGNHCDIVPELKNALLQFTSSAFSLQIQTLAELKLEYTSMRPAIIEGLLRCGELMNIIAAPKTGKSWLVLMMVLSVAAGINWLGKYATKRGKVLLVDNELHGETLADRLPRVAQAMGLTPEQYTDNVEIILLRGQLVDLRKLCEQLLQVEPGTYSMIILDAFYRFLPENVDENSNAQITQLYNLEDNVAGRIGASIVNVLHTSKGNQSAKSVTDTGAGAGSQSRCPDTHMVLRQHEIDGVVSVDAAVRSFQSIRPFCLRYEHPIWTPDDGPDPSNLKKERRKAASKKPDKPDAEQTLAMKERIAEIRILELYDSLPDGETLSAAAKAVKMSCGTFKKYNDTYIDAGFLELVKVKKCNASRDGFRLSEHGRSELRQLRQLRQTQELSVLSHSDNPDTGHPLKGGVSVLSELSDQSIGDFSELTFITTMN